MSDEWMNCGQKNEKSKAIGGEVDRDSVMLYAIVLRRKEQ